MKNWRSIMFFFLFILFLSFDLSAKDALLELKNELEAYELSPNPRQKTVIFELASEVEKQHGIKVAWKDLNLLYQKELTFDQANSLKRALKDLKAQTDKGQSFSMTQTSQLISLFFMLFVLAIFPFALRKKSKKTAQAHWVLSKRKKPLSLELKGLSFVLNHKGQLIEMSEEAASFFPQVDKDNFSAFIKSHLLYVNLKSASNLVKLRNIKELEHKLYYYKSKNLEHLGKNFRLIKLVEVTDLGLGLDNSSSTL